MVLNGFPARFTVPAGWMKAGWSETFLGRRRPGWLIGHFPFVYLKFWGFFFYTHPGSVNSPRLLRLFIPKSTIKVGPGPRRFEALLALNVQSIIDNADFIGGLFYFAC